MRIESSSRPQHSLAPALPSLKEEVMATGTGLVVEDKVAIKSDIKKNDPSDPLVAKKILDSLDMGFINFKQEERDALDSILNKKRTV